VLALISKLRIGAKLAIVSGIEIVFVVMIASQIIGREEIVLTSHRVHE
jgi:hypothetical protein